tara:strand:+ start:600 stop:827 length:228 start_codon:yes stop_codon:yes gene_type:complete
MFQAIKKLTGIKRLNNSINGNPNYKLYFGNEVVRTPEDSMLAYKISDTYLGKDCQIIYYYNDKEQAYLKDINKLD